MENIPVLPGNPNDKYVFFSKKKRSRRKKKKKLVFAYYRDYFFGFFNYRININGKCVNSCLNCLKNVLAEYDIN